jgi:hypothetical protein
MLLRAAAALVVLFGAMFGVGAVVLLRWPLAAAMALLAVLGGIALRALRAAEQDSV